MNDRLDGTGSAGNPELDRLAESRERGVPWKLWGPYLSQRQWGTVREDYSERGNAWEYFPHEHARSRAYRWGEDGLLGFSDDHGYFAFAPSLWNGNDPILKERLFGLTGNEGNHGEDVKEYYYFLDNTPTHSYQKALYKYPHAAFPYDRLVSENRSRGRDKPEFELIDTGVFDENRYFDVMVEYAKASPDDMVIRLSTTNRGPDTATIHLLPTFWFRNIWSWGFNASRPSLMAMGDSTIRARHDVLGEYWIAFQGGPRLLFTENETNSQKLWGLPSSSKHVKDAFNDFVIHGRRESLNGDEQGTKAAAHYVLTIAPGETQSIYVRFSDERRVEPFADAAAIIELRKSEADVFYEQVGRIPHTDEAQSVQRQAFAGLLWSKQLYNFDVARWLDGDPAGPPPPAGRKHGRNAAWRHLSNRDVISMPDTWEYPWYAAWDLAFHCIPLALIDPDFAKEQLILLNREWFMHPNGQLPAYEWAFGDVNPPVQAWAALRVYKIDRRLTGKADVQFLERVLHKLILNFTWWVNRKDPDDRNVFQGGFLGLDNIGVFDRSAPLPTGGHLEQSDGTAWMGMFCLNMLAIALELAGHNRVYEDVATKFFEHFMYIAGALNDIAGTGLSLWDEEDEFFYDVLHTGDSVQRLKVRSLVGLIPLLAVETVEPDLLEKLPEFRRRLEWFIREKPELSGLISRWYEPGKGDRRLLALARGHRMKRLLARMLDPNEFLSDYGIRALSKHHSEHPFVLNIDGSSHEVRYEPAESSSGLFGGNSNWRGPIWFPINFLLVEALQKFHHYYSDDFLVECPTGSGNRMTLWEVGEEISRRLVKIFLRDPAGRRPVFGATEKMQTDPHWRDHLLFFEYFNGDTGAGVGASHQTGWTALVAKLLDQLEDVNL